MFYLFLGLLSVRLRTAVSGSERQPEIDVLTAGALFAVVAAGQPGLRLISDPLQAGLASIVELSQAQLQQTQALIGSAQAMYQYRLALAVLNFQIANF